MKWVCMKQGAHWLLTKFQEFSRSSPGVLQGKKFAFPGPNTKFFSWKNKTMSSNFCHSSSNWNRVYIKYKNYNHELDASAGLFCLYNWWNFFHKIQGVFKEFSRSFPGVQGNYLFFKEFLRPIKKISKFQEFSRSQWVIELISYNYKLIIIFSCLTFFYHEISYPSKD